MKEPSPPSVLVTLLRAGVLLATIVLLPGIAICWNSCHDFSFWKHGDTQTEISDSVTSESDALPSPEIFVGIAEQPAIHSAEPMTVSPFATENSAISGTSSSESMPLRRLSGIEITNPIRQMSLTNAAEDENFGNGSVTPPIFEYNAMQASAAAANAEQCTDFLPIHPETGGTGMEQTQRDLSQLEATLKQFGATSCRLEKWGTSGHLYRFSCYASPKENHHYRKLFQAIDSQESRAVERVINEIHRWRNE